MANKRLDDLLDQWQSLHVQGIDRTPLELCRDCPELAEQLAARIRSIAQIESLSVPEDRQTVISHDKFETSLKPGQGPAKEPTKTPPFRPFQFGNFRMLKLLGQGGMGAVYLAEDEKLSRQVALKVMKSELASDSEAVQRFLREAKAMAAIEHEHIISVYAVGEHDGQPFLVMPVLKGESLHSRLSRCGRLSVMEACRIAREIASGLWAAHGQGLIHRDIKPGNIWLEGIDGSVRILDFGLARPMADDQRLTQSGAILGTPGYMAPEQAAGGKTTPATDLFSLGAVLYHMLTGQQPFTGANLMATLHNLANRTPKAVSTLNPDVPPLLSDLVSSLLKKTPRHRPESAGVVVEILDEVRSGTIGVAGTRMTQRLAESVSLKSGGRSSPDLSSVPLLPNANDSKSGRSKVLPGLIAVVATVLIAVLGLLFVNRDSSKQTAIQQVQADETQTLADENSKAVSEDANHAVERSISSEAGKNHSSGEIDRGEADVTEQSNSKSSDPVNAVAVSEGPSSERMTKSSDVSENAALVNGLSSVSPSGEEKKPEKSSTSSTESPVVDAKQSSSTENEKTVGSTPKPRRKLKWQGETTVDAFQVTLVGAGSLDGMQYEIPSGPVTVTTPSFDMGANGSGGSFSGRFQFVQEPAAEIRTPPSFGLAFQVKRTAEVTTGLMETAVLADELQLLMSPDKADEVPLSSVPVRVEEFEAKNPEAACRYFVVPGLDVANRWQVKGTLNLTEYRVEELKFPGNSSQTKRTKKGRRIAVNLVGQPNAKQQVEMQVSTAAPKQQGTFYFSSNDENDGVRYEVQLVDNQGGVHAAVFQTGGGGSASTMQNGNREIRTIQKLFRFEFAPMAGGLTTETIVVRIAEPTGKTRAVSFALPVESE